MGLESLFLFTLLGGLGAGTYVFETCVQRSRKGERPWLVPVCVVVLFAVGMVAASTHVQSMSRAMGALGAGTVNFGAGMVKEIAISGCFFVLALIDMVVTLAKKDSPYWLRVLTAVVAVLCLVEMGLAYTDVYGNAVWCDAAATVCLFVGGALAMGAGLSVALGSGSLDDKPTKALSIVFNAALLVGMVLEAVACAAHGVSAVPQVVGLVIAPAVSLVLVCAAPKVQNKQALAWGICVLSIVGVAISRYAFYAAVPMM